jgi:hypothetical protein
MAKSRRQGFRLTLGGGHFERHKRLKKFAGFHFFTRFGRVEADPVEARLVFGGARLSPRHQETQDCGLAADRKRNLDDIDAILMSASPTRCVELT